MIRFEAFGIRFSLPLLTLIVPILASRLGMQGMGWPLISAVFAHELAHILAARCTGIKIQEIRLMPFGGSARMENPYLIPAGRLFFIAIAGPAVNLCIAVLAAASAQWQLIASTQANAIIRPNLILFFFNLLPALPLDGGRMLYALLQRFLGEEVSLRIAVWMGRIVAGSLLCCAVFFGLHSGIWNLSFILAAVFMFSSVPDEKSAFKKSKAERLAALLDQSGAFRPAHIYQLDAQTPVLCALRSIRPREAAWFVLTCEGMPCGMIDSRSILQHLIKNGAPDAALGALPLYRFSTAKPSGAL